VWSYSIKIIVYSKEGKKITLSLVEYIWHIFETNVTLQKVASKAIYIFKSLLQTYFYNVIYKIIIMVKKCIF